MFIAVVLVCVISMIAAAWRDGVQEGPRPARAKLVFGLLLVLSLYHMTETTGWIRLYDFYDAANALLKPAADGLYHWFNAKG